MKKLALIKDVSEFWKIYEPMFREYSIDVVTLDIFNYADQQRLLNEDWDGVFWRAKHDPKYRDLAKKIISLFGKHHGLKTFPSWDEYWHYDDKMAQSFLFTKLNIPTPKTFVFYNKSEAIEFLEQINFPIIFKAPFGAGSANVGLLQNKRHAKRYINKVFGKGVKTFFKEDLQRFFVYFQEFLTNNKGGYRVVCHGKKMLYGYFKYNDKNSQFATGLGEVDLSPLPEDLLEFAHGVHKKLGFPQVMSYDILKDNSGNYSVLEMSVIYSGLESFKKNIDAIKFELNEKNKFVQMDSKINYHEYFIENLLKNWGWVD